MKVNSIEKI